MKTDRPNRQRALQAVGQMMGQALSYSRKGTLPINGVIKDQTARHVQAFLALHPRAEEITVEIDSIGGSPTAARKIYDELRAHGAWINCIVEEKCASAAVTVLLAGDWREAEPHAQILIHECNIDHGALASLQEDGRSTATILRQIANKMVDHDRKHLKLYALRTSTPIDVLERAIRNPDDKPMSLARAQGLGFIHAIAGQTIYRQGRPYVWPNDHR